MLDHVMLVTCGMADGLGEGSARGGGCARVAAKRGRRRMCSGWGASTGLNRRPRPLTGSWSDATRRSHRVDSRGACQTGGFPSESAWGHVVIPTCRVCPGARASPYPPHIWAGNRGCRSARALEVGLRGPCGSHFRHRGGLPGRLRRV
ncbi:hypothetical protein D1007_48351 [Hordeum vulgare]|nr:hypothetical protein D1007_48351 [Hordeum vulgare]